MPYIIEVVQAGKTIEVMKYYSSRYGKKGIKRGKRQNLTKEEQIKVNKRAAEKKLRRLINENFQEGDTHLVLDYRKERRPAGRKQMRADADDFLKEMRKLYKRHGIPFKYIHVMEIGKKGALHHHLVINTPEEISQQAIVRCWKGRGRTHHNPLDDTGQYAKLAAYLIKQSDGMLRDPEALQGKRWNSSRNLRKPKVLRKEPIKDKGWYTGFVLVFYEETTGRFIVVPYLYTPKETVAYRQHKDNNPYEYWIKKGDLIALDGKYVNFERFLDHAVELDEKYRIEQIGFDQWGSTTIINRLEDRWDVIPIGQGTKTMTQVINDFENLLVDERLVIAENECFRFMAKNCIAVYDEMLGVKYSKKKSKFKIDGVIAMLMGLLLCIEENGIEHYNPVEYLDAM